jgi:colicin import membrane protein
MVLASPTAATSVFTLAASPPEACTGGSGWSRRSPEAFWGPDCAPCSGCRLSEAGSRKIDDKAARKAAKELERARQLREAERRKEEAAQARERERRDRTTEKTQAALDEAQREHEAKAGAIEAERDAIEKRAQAEEARWGTEREKLKAALRRARDD